MKVLITGFDPFGGETINPAYEAVKAIPEIQGVDLIKVEIPTVFHKSKDHLKKAMDQHKPDIIICVGQAGGRSHVTLERVAINVDDARIPDNDGQQPIDQPVVEHGPAAYFTNLPIKAMAKAIQDAGLPGGISNTAGTYVCNHIMYQLMHMIKDQPGLRGGFIHVPFIESQVVHRNGVSSMSLASISQALQVAILAAVSHDEDIKETAGTIC